MNQFKRAKVIMLPTENISPINLCTLHLHNSKIFNHPINSISQHLYIISDDEIKEGDWFYTPSKRSIEQCVKQLLIIKNGNSDVKQLKIIATTDTNISSKEITPFGRQFIKPSQQFIEKYIESYNAGQVINDVLVEYSYNNPEPNRNILCLKVNSKDNTITIKKLKDNWNREEVTEILLDRGISKEWIEKNL